MQELHVYITARSRRTTREEDRIYGIQQIFGLRLGNTTPSTTRKTFNFEQLDAQLGEELLLKYPIQSQMHVFLCHVPPRAHWRGQPCSQTFSADMCRTDRILDGGPRERTDPRDAAYCQFLVDHNSRTAKPVHFAGHMSSFDKLNQSWDEIVQKIALMRCRESGLDDRYIDCFGLDPLILELDAISELSGAPRLGINSKEIIQWLLQRFPDDQLQVLLLGIHWYSKTTGLYPRAMYGLLMLPYQELWARVGVCRWSCQYDYTSPHIGLQEGERSFLRGDGELWVE